MERWVIRSCRLSSFLCLVTGLTFLAHAQNRDGRSFGGNYKVLEASEQGDQMKLRVSLRVINYSGADVQHATIWLTSSLSMEPGAVQPDWVKQQLPFRNVSLNYNEHKIVAPLVGKFTIPVEEYGQWQRGVPNFVIYYRDPAGKRRHERIALTPAP
jgi:hypothetical protein